MKGGNEVAIYLKLFAGISVNRDNVITKRPIVN